MDSYKKNPFSLYDFLGYVFPGLVTLYIVWFFVTQKSDIEGLPDMIKRITNHLSGSSKTSSLSIAIEETILITVASYIIGHFVAYLSSITVEQFAIWVYDYPSKFLLKDVPSNNFWNSNGNEKLKLWYKRIWRVVMCILLLPISIGTLVFGKFLKLREFFIKKLDDYLILAIETNQLLMAKYLGIQKEDDMDFHRIVYHYEYEKQSRHSQKMDNYVALYGFLRSLTFIINCTFLWILGYYGIRSIFTCYKEYNWNFLNGELFNTGLMWLLIGLGMLTYVFFMAFMKFYRRFTLESFMCLVTDTSYKKTQEVVIPNYNYDSAQPEQSQIILPHNYSRTET